MPDGDPVKRAVAVINAAIRHSMFPGGVMPESDGDKIAEADKLVVMAGQAKAVADAVGKSRVNNYQAVMEILIEAGVADTSTQEAQPSAPLSTSSPQAPASSVPVTQGQPVTPSLASSASLPSVSVEQQAQSVAPHPVDPDGILAEPKVGEQWDATGGGRWFLVADHGAMVEAVSVVTGESTVLPKGFLKNKMTEAFVGVEVDAEWNVQGARGYNMLWYSHWGCVKWYAPLDGSVLPAVGQTVQCVTCEAVLPIMTVEPNGYVPTPSVATPVQASQPVPTQQSQQQGHQPMMDSSVPKLNEIHLRAEPALGIKVFTHVGCSSWSMTTGGKPLGLDGAALLSPGVKGPCPTCGDQDVPLTQVDANGYDPATYAQPASPSPVPSIQEVAPSVVSPPSPPQQASPAVPPTSSPSSASTLTTSSTPSSTVPPSVPAPPSSPSGSIGSSTSRSTGAPVDDHEGDAEYLKILNQAESDFLPEGMPAPQDLESPPPAMPEDLTANPEANRELHSKFNALAARARYLAKIDERVARDCGRAVRLRLRPHMAKAKKELGASSTLTERREWAEEIGGDDVRLWLDRQQKHADRAEAYGEFFSIYTSYVSVLSRDLTWAQNEERGA